MGLVSCQCWSSTSHCPRNRTEKLACRNPGRGLSRLIADITAWAPWRPCQKGNQPHHLPPVRAKPAREPPPPGVLQLSWDRSPLHRSCWGSSPETPGFLHLPPPTHQVLFLSRGALTCLLTPHPGPWHIAGDCGMSLQGGRDRPLHW